MFNGLSRLIKMRESENAFVSCADNWTVETGDQNLLCIGRYYEEEKILGIFKMSECDKTACLHEDGVYQDLLTGNKMKADEVPVKAYGFYYLKAVEKFSIL